VDDPLFVRRFQGLGNLTCKIQSPIDVQWTARQHCCEIFTGNQLHRDEAFALRAFVQTVDRGDIGVIQRGEKLGLAFEPCQTICVSGQGLGQHFDRHLAFESHVGCPIDLTHAALAELVDDGVIEKLRALF